MQPCGFESHDHTLCVHNAVKAAQSYCATHKLRLTPLRQQVLKLLLSEHRAFGAYEILELLRATQQIYQPPAIYRILDFWVQHGFVHKIERLNAFIGCTHPKTKHTPVFLICRQCNLVQEKANELRQNILGDAAQSIDFTIERTTIEAMGLCAGCKDAEHTT